MHISLVDKLGRLETALIVTLSLLIFFPCSSLQDTRGEPVNIGFICGLPWDISNTLRAPIGGPVAVMLSAIMAGILLFGFLLAPVHYILGYPSRIYHPARQPGLITDFLYTDKTKRSFGDEGQINLEFLSTPPIANLSSTNLVEDIEDTNELNSFNAPHIPDFVNSAFMFIPEQDIECRKLILCHAHALLQSLPQKITKFIRFFSKRAISVPEEYKTAVIRGLKDQNDCMKAYQCHKDISLILKDILFNLVSADMKKLWNLSKLF